MKENQIIAALLDRIVKNDSTAYADFSRKTFGIVTGMCVKYGISKEDAKDIFSDALLALLEDKKAGKLENHSNIIGRFVETAKNKAYDFIEKRKRKEQLKSELREGADENALDDEGAVEREEKFVDIEAALSTLSESCQKLIQEYIYEGKKLVDIAQEKGIEAGSIRKRFFDCREKLRAMPKMKKYFLDS